MTSVQALPRPPCGLDRRAMIGHGRCKRAALGSAGLQQPCHPTGSAGAHRRRSVGARSSSNGRGSGVLTGWLQAGKFLKDAVLSHMFQEEPSKQLTASSQDLWDQHAAKAAGAAEAEQQPATAQQAVATAPRVQPQEEQQQVAHEQLRLATQPPPQQPNFYHANGASAAGTAAGTAAGGATNGTASGPVKASASDLLAGVPLQQMRERRQAQQQLQRLQQQHLGGGGPAPTASPSPSHSASHGSLWGSTSQPAADPSAGNAPSSAAPTSNASSSSSRSSSSSGDLRAELSPVTSPEAAVAFAAYERAVGARRMVPVRLTMQLQAAEGQRVVVVGSHKSLGKWAVDAALEMRRTEGDTWEGTVKLPAGSISEYKYAVVDAAGNAVALQAGNNGVLAVGFADERLEVMDSWAGDAAGVSVVVDGDRAAWPATRESRLVAWANDLFQQVANLRQDLRKSRMELVGAQEETRDARLEAQRLLGELEEMRGAMAELEAERSVERAELAHTRALNNVLQTQLADTTASLQEAIQTAADLLVREVEGEEEEDEEKHASPGRLSSTKAQ